MDDSLQDQLLSSFSDELPPKSAAFLNSLVETICELIAKGHGEDEIEKAIDAEVDSILLGAESSLNN